MTPEQSAKLDALCITVERMDAVVRQLAQLVIAHTALSQHIANELVVNRNTNYGPLTREKAIEYAVQICLARMGVLQN